MNISSRLTKLTLLVGLSYVVSFPQSTTFQRPRQFECPAGSHLWSSTRTIDGGDPKDVKVRVDSNAGEWQSIAQIGLLQPNSTSFIVSKPKEILARTTPVTGTKQSNTTTKNTQETPKTKSITSTKKDKPVTSTTNRKSFIHESRDAFVDSSLVLVPLTVDPKGPINRDDINAGEFRRVIQTQVALPVVTETPSITPEKTTTSSQVGKGKPPVSEQKSTSTVTGTPPSRKNHRGRGYHGIPDGEYSTNREKSLFVLGPFLSGGPWQNRASAWGLPSDLSQKEPQFFLL